MPCPGHPSIHLPTPIAEGSKGKNSPGSLPCPNSGKHLPLEQITKSSSFSAQDHRSSPLARAQQLSDHLAEKVKGRQGDPYLPAITCLPATVPLPGVGPMPGDSTKVQGNDKAWQRQARPFLQVQGWDIEAREDVPPASSLMGASAVPRI